MQEMNRKILIVDDDPVSGQVLQKRLESRGFQAIIVNSGASCLEKIKKDSFDLILMDIIMPEISGLDVLDEIRKTQNATELPIIMVTSKNENSDVVDALRRGANDYLVKPVNIDIAMARIKTQINVKELVRQSLALKQVATIGKMVGTLNHEINNPLAIAVGNISLLQRDIGPNQKLDKASDALDRITELVKKIKELSESEQLEEIEYSSNQNIFKIK